MPTTQPNSNTSPQAKKTGLAVWLLLILVILAGGWYLYQKQQQSSSLPEPARDLSIELADYFSNQDLVETVELEMPPEVRTRFENDLERYLELQTDPNNEYQGYMGEALSYMQLGDYRMALEKMLALTERYPEDELVFHNLGDLYVKMKQYLSAAEAFTQAVANKPEEVYTQLRLAEHFVKYSREPHLAELIYQQASVTTGGHSEVLKNYAVFLEEVKGDYPTAVTLWRQIQDLETDEQLLAAIAEKIIELENK